MIRYQFNRENVAHVCKNLRPLDFYEISGENMTDTVEEIIDDTMMSGPLCFVFGDEDGPIAVIGATQMTPTRYQVFMYATDDFKKIWKPLTRFAIRGIMPQLLAQGMMRAECRSSAEHLPAHEWLEFLGAKFEGVCRANGKFGEDYFLYAWTREDVLRRRQSEEGSETAEGG